jgi:1-acyl-sn-glycerol-3-phosphate acyltransferase
MRLLWRLYLKLLGWNVSLSNPYPHLKKFVIIVGPHTSNWDFVVLLAYRSILRLKSGFLGKKELFKPPFGFIFHGLGGIPVDRKQSHNLVDDVAKIIEQRETFIIALSPEGTRKKVEKLRTGFYFIASKARIPIVMVGLDYKNKTIHFSEPLMPSDQVRDFNTIFDFYRTIEGKYPEQGLMHK